MPICILKQRAKESFHCDGFCGKQKVELSSPRVGSQRDGGTALEGSIYKLGSDWKHEVHALI